MRRPSPRDAAVTGVDVVSPAGHGVEALWDALRSRRRATAPRARVAEPFLRVAVPPDLESQAKFLNGASAMAAHVVARAVESSRLAAAGHGDGAKGFYLAQIDPSVIDYAAYRQAMEEATDGFAHAPSQEALNAASVRKMNPFYLLSTLNNNSFSLISAWHGLRGANTSLSGWKGPGIDAISLGARAVSRGDASAVVACGASRLAGEITAMEMERLHVLADGLVPGEGAAAVVLEPLSDATARGVVPLAVVVGHGTGFGTGAKRPDALRIAAKAACAEAGVAVGDVAAVFADDGASAKAAGGGNVVLVSRATTGEMGPASDAADVVLAALALSRGVLPDGTPCRGAVLVVTCGLEGQAAALVLARAA